MPNWVTNTITIRGDEKVLNKIIKECTNKDGDFDFELVIPMPDNIYRGPLGLEEEKKYGAENCWYMWSINNWGTKWNCNDTYVGMSDGKLIIEFQTAWSTPEPIIYALADNYHIDSIECKYADEDMGSNCGTYGWSNDEGSYDEYPDNPLKFACEMWGWDYDDYMAELEQ